MFTSADPYDAVHNQDAIAQYGFTLERLSGVILPDLAALHCPLEQEVDHWSGPTVPLVLGGATVASCVGVQ